MLAQKQEKILLYHNCATIVLLNIMENIFMGNEEEIWNK